VSQYVTVVKQVMSFVGKSIEALERKYFVGKEAMTKE
jgi:hypothetical protein